MQCQAINRGYNYKTITRRTILKLQAVSAVRINCIQHKKRRMCTMELQYAGSVLNSWWKDFTTQQKQLVDPVLTRHAAFTWIRQHYQQCGEGFRYIQVNIRSVHCKQALYRKFETNTVFTEMKLRGLVPNAYIHVSVSDLYSPTIGLPILLHDNRWTDRGNT